VRTIVDTNVLVSGLFALHPFQNIPILSPAAVVRSIDPLQE
jgi:hypothetical protein